MILAVFSKLNDSIILFYGSMTLWCFHITEASAVFSIISAFLPPNSARCCKGYYPRLPSRFFLPRENKKAKAALYCNSHGV